MPNIVDWPGSRPEQRGHTFLEAGFESASEWKAGKVQELWRLKMETWRSVDEDNRWGRRLEGWPNTAEAWGEWPSRVWFFTWWTVHLACPDGPYRLPRSGAAQLIVLVIVVVHKQPTWKSVEITHGVPRHFSRNTYRLPVMRIRNTIPFTLYPSQMVARSQVAFFVASVQSQLVIFLPNVEHLFILFYACNATDWAEFWKEAVVTAGWGVIHIALKNRTKSMQIKQIIY